MARLPGLHDSFFDHEQEATDMRHNQLGRRVRRIGYAMCLAMSALCVASAAPAMADDEVTADTPVTAETTVASQQECQDPTLLQPFAGWTDNRQYVLAPGGDFSDPTGSGWQFDGGAQIVDDTRPDGTTGGVLYMKSGSTAVSPVMCVDMNYPTARAWVRKVGGDGDVSVSVVYAGSKEASVPKKVGSLHANNGKGRWDLSDDVKVNPQLAGKFSGWRRVAFVFRAEGRTGEFMIDDFYVDPRMRG